MKRHILSVLGYMAATFATQAASHFLLFQEHYAAVSMLRPNPNFALGFASMIIQGTVLSIILARSEPKAMFDSVKLAWLFGVFLVSYIALAEAGKYTVPDIASWIGVEALAGFVQFSLAGVLIGLAHRKGVQ
ncbi:MAG: hypothetical protein C4534_00940 [Gaiellales bacterium]|nr:MAG: hypothetical protein C4534_00940 [Gaiellales bacterium]